jgi:hypothetical protein
MSTATVPSPTPQAASTASRLSLRPVRTHAGAVDGVWWPRADTAEELLALAAAVEPSFQKVVRVAVHMQSWPGVSHRLGTGPLALRVDLFRTGEAHTVRLVGEDGHLLDLLVIAPDTDAATAEREMAAGADGTDLRPVAELLGAQ